MQHGLHVRLNPQGGNQLNIREALRLLNPPPTPPPQSENDSDTSEANDTDAREPRRTIQDDYDYDDDFIDDGELIEDDEEVPTTPPESPEPPPAQAEAAKASPPITEGQQSNPTKPNSVPMRAPVDHGFAVFYVNRGQLPSRANLDTVAIAPKSDSKLGNVKIDFPPRSKPRTDRLAPHPNPAQPDAVGAVKAVPDAVPRGNVVPAAKTKGVQSGSMGKGVQAGSVGKGVQASNVGKGAQAGSAAKTAGKPGVKPSVAKGSVSKAQTQALEAGQVQGGKAGQKAIPPVPKPTKADVASAAKVVPDAVLLGNVVPAAKAKVAQGGGVAKGAQVGSAVKGAQVGSAGKGAQVGNAGKGAQVGNAGKAVGKPVVKPSAAKGSASKGQTQALGGGQTPGGKAGQKAIPKLVMIEIEKLSELCVSKFGDKKPRLNDPRLQEQLDTLFRVAIITRSATLYSDIVKDRRIVSLSDDIWGRVSVFLRTKRANLETLGHALIWSAREKDAMKSVEVSEEKLCKLLEKRRGKSSSEVMMTLGWDDEVDTLMHEWYKAKASLLAAKNQLGSRVKQVKKSMGMWVASLKKQVFHGWSVGESELSDAIRRKEERIATERREQMEKKRKRMDSDVDGNSAGGSDGAVNAASSATNANGGNKKVAVENGQGGVKSVSKQMRGSN